MSNSNNVIELKTVKTYVISPKIFYQDISNPDNDKPYDGSRINMLRCLHGMLEFESDLLYDTSTLFISRLEMEVRKDTLYWGGDGIVVGIPSCYTAQNLRDALVRNFEVGSELVVFDPSTKEYYGADRPEIQSTAPTCPTPTPN